MQHLPSKRVFALVFGLAAGAAGSAHAQDTTDMGRATMDTTAPGAGALDTAGVDTSATARDTASDTSATGGRTGADTSAGGDTTGTSGVQNPPGYRGMERDTTMFPPSDDPKDPDHAKGRATGVYSDSAWQDTSGAEQNPPGYRGMERPVEGDAAGRDTASDTSATGGRTGADTSTSGDTWQDTTGAGQDPAGDRGMEGPAEGDPANRDTTSVGDTETRVEDEATPRLDPSESGTGDTTAQSADSIQ